MSDECLPIPILGRYIATVGFAAGPVFIEAGDSLDTLEIDFMARKVRVDTPLVTFTMTFEAFAQMTRPHAEMNVYEAPRARQ